MPKAGAKRSMGGLTITLLASLLMAAPASANGPCGQDFDGPTACPVNTASTSNYLGSMVTDNESDYYVFYAQEGTELSVTITDTENPVCSNPPPGPTVGCGHVSAALDDAHGDELDESANNNGGNDSSPVGGITVPATFSHTIDTTGTYYLIVTSSFLGSFPPLPYTLSVTASPNVQWPPPPPPPPKCKVPRFGGASLSTVTQRIVNNHCTVGRVIHRYNRAHKGLVIAMNRRPGIFLPYRSAINVTISAGQKPKHPK